MKSSEFISIDNSSAEPPRHRGEFSASAASVLRGKSAIFVGDSIMVGGRDDIDGADPADGLGWGYRIREHYGMTVDIAAQSGQAMSVVRDAYTSPIYKQVEKKKDNCYDYVILQGGFNDIYGNEHSAARETAPLGMISGSYDISDFDRRTFSSALEHLLCYATTVFPRAKIGFVITHETPYSRRGNGTNDRNTTKRYFDLAKQICDKWNVPYLDFYDGTAADGMKYFDIFYPEGRSLVSQCPNGIYAMDTLQHLKDDIHPNKAGYDATYKYMAQWMETLPTYSNPSAVSVLRHKTVLFAGDSITCGFLDSAPAPRSWAYRLQRDYGMIVTNNGKNGHSLSDVRDYSAAGGEDKRLHKKCFDNGLYDYVILHGGVNDIMDSVPIGNISASKNPTDYDPDSFAGGLERYFYEATTRYPSARIGFIINFRTPISTWGGNTKEADAYWSIAREICKKWNIPFLDLYEDGYSIDVLKANTTACLGDTLHLNAMGYDVITPHIARWMAALEVYSSEQGSASDASAFIDGAVY